jgi:hypothetical protein
MQLTLFFFKLSAGRPSTRRFSMCWSTYEREQWERFQLEREAERLRTISSEPERKEPEAPEAEVVEEREGELVRV